MTATPDYRHATGNTHSHSTAELGPKTHTHPGGHAPHQHDPATGSPVALATDPRPNPIHTDRTVESIDVRLYFPKEGLDTELALSMISKLLQGDPLTPEEDFVLCSLVSAYQLKNNGFGSLLPERQPLA